MKYTFLLATILIFSYPSYCRADVIFDLYGGGELTSLLEGKTHLDSYTTGGITASFTANGGTMHRIDAGFGINSTDTSDATYALDPLESLDISFDQDVTITQLDFRNFGPSESFQVVIGTLTYNIAHNDLDSPAYGLKQYISWEATKGQTVRFQVAGTHDAIAIDSITVKAIPEPTTIALFLASGIALLTGRRFFA